MHFLKSVRTRFRSYHLKSGLFHFNRGEFKQGVEFFRRALKEPGIRADEKRATTSFMTQAYLGWSEELSDEGDRPNALEKLKAALDISPGYADMHCRHGVLLRELGELDSAKKAFLLALDLNEAYVEARIQLGYLLLEEGKTEEAAAEFERAFLLNIKRIERPFFEGKTLLLEGEIPRGRDLIRKAFDRRPYEAEKHFKDGLRSLRGEHWLEAVEHFDRVIELDKAYADVHNYLGLAAFECGRPEDAAASFRMSLDINPRFIAARLNLAFLLHEADADQEALDEINLVLEQEPDCTPALDLHDELSSGKVSHRA